MKKVILLIIGCLAYVAVQAQNSETIITIEQIEKNVQQKVQLITSEVSFTDIQKDFLKELLVYSAKTRAGTFSEELKANPIKDVNMDTFFTQEQRNAINKQRGAMIPSIDSNNPLTRTSGTLEPSKNGKISKF